MSIDFLLFGNMASGKTSIAQILRNEFAYEVISAKDIILRNLPTAAENVKKLRAKGFLLPDEIVIGWVLGEIDKLLEKNARVILDGFPRTELQAKSVLEKYGGVGQVVYLDFPFEVVKKHFENRLLCDTCEMPYSELFTDFDNECVYCKGTSFSPRPTDRPDYFSVKTSQFESESMQVLPVLRSAGLKFTSIGDHTEFSKLRAEAVSLVGDK